MKLSIELAKDADKYNEIKNQLKNNLKIERINNNKIYTNNLELAFEKVYFRKHNNLVNENIYI